MPGSLNRIGIVSSIDYRKGMVSVTYPDRDKSTTKAFPFLCAGDEYCMPNIGDQVFVAHLSNNTAAGVVIGKFFNIKNLPEKYGKGVVRKKLGEESYIECVDDEITFHDKNGTVALKDIIDLMNAGSEGGT